MQFTQTTVSLALMFALVHGAVAQQDTVWLDDDTSPCLQQSGFEFIQYGPDPWLWGWEWNANGSPAPHSGTQTHSEQGYNGYHQHWFGDSSHTLPINAGEILFVYVYLDPVNPPTEVMLQWQVADPTGYEHRAYWGTDSVQMWGTNNTVSRRRMGDLPPTGQWVRLVVPASVVGLENRQVLGMAFTSFGGRTFWDDAGKTTQPTEDPVVPPISILWQHSAGMAAVWEMAGSTVKRIFPIHGVRAQDGDIVGAHDFDLDGERDLLLRRRDGALWIGFVKGSRVVNQTPFSSTSIPQEAKIVGFSDFDRDGTQELVWHSGDAIHMCSLSGSTAVGEQTITGIVDPQVVDLADLNGDEQTDIISRSAGGRLKVTYLMGTEILSTDYLNSGQPEGGRWKAVGAADFNGDGIGDLLLRHADGCTVIWYMNGSARIGTFMLRNHTPKLTPWRSVAVD